MLLAVQQKFNLKNYFQLESPGSLEATPDEPLTSFNEKVVEKDDIVKVYIIFTPIEEPDSEITLKEVTVVGCKKESTTTSATSTSTTSTPCTLVDLELNGGEIVYPDGKDPEDLDPTPEDPTVLEETTIVPADVKYISVDNTDEV